MTRRSLFACIVMGCGLVAFPLAEEAGAVRPEPRIEALEVLRTDPAAPRTPAGQRDLTREAPAWQRFLATHGPGWRVTWNELSQTPHRIFGNQVPAARLAPGVQPSGPRDKAAILELARGFVTQNADLLGVGWDDLRPVFVGFRGGRWVVTLKQVARGIEVLGGRLDLRFSAAGDLMLFGADTYPVPAWKGVPRLSAANAWDAARRDLPQVQGRAPSEPPALVLVPLLADEPRRPGDRKPRARATLAPSDLRVRLAWRIHVRTADPVGDWETYVDAHTGQVLARTNRVRFANVSGTVSGDIRPLLGTDPPVTVAFPDAGLFGGAPTGTVASWDFESGPSGWTAQAPWALSGESTNSGSQAWSDSPGGNYGNNLNLLLTSPVIDISAVTDPVLVYWTRLQLEDTWDFLYVEASADGGSTWQLLDARTGTLPWHQERVDLAPVAGTATLQVRFRLFTDPAVTDDGAWIDDVSLASLGSAVTDAVGNYALTTTGGSDTVTTRLVGRYTRITNQAGNDGVASGVATGPTLDLAWSDANSLPSERDMYVGLNIAHARLKQIDPAFTALDYPLPVFVGQAFCNAYWAGSQVVMGAGVPGCADLGTWIPVMHHEYAHGITDFLYEPVQDPPSTMHEAFSDYYAATITGDPRVGPDILGPGTMFRTIDNKLRTPEDIAGEVHTDGTILAGALWDMRNALLPDVDLADSLFHFARYGFPTTFEDYYLEVLTVDDDDGNLGNGTPHETILRSTFGAHGIGTGPQFQHVVVNVLDGLGNGDGRLDPGETADLRLTVHNYGTAQTGVYARILSQTAGVTVLADSVSFGNVPGTADQTASGLFTVSVADTVPVGTAVLFDLDVFTDTGFNADCFMLPVGYVPILVVDDDRTRTFESWITDALDNLGKPWTRWVAGVLGSPPAEVMAQYRAVVWFTGNDRVTTLAPGDQDELAAYLGGGGALFLSGEDIGDDLWAGASGTPTPADIAFYETWLHSQVDVDNEGTPAPGVVGEAGDVVGDGLAFALNEASSAGNQSSVSSLLPQSGAVAALRYDNGRVAAVRFEGAYKLLYCGFGFEGVGPQAARDSLMARVMNWMCPSESVAPQVAVVSPNGGEMLIGTSQTTIQWTASDSIAVLFVDISLSTDGGSTFTPIATSVPNRFTYDWTVNDVSSSQCMIRVEAVDPSSNVGFDVSDSTFTITASTDVADTPLPRRFALHPAYPNPFNPRTTVRFDLPRDETVWLDILGVDGRRVRSLIAGRPLTAGQRQHQWDGRDDHGRAVASGVYLVRLRAGAFSRTQKISLLK